MIRFLIILFGLVLSPFVHANGKIMIFGDSLSAGYGLQKNEGWVDLLQQKLDREKFDYRVINSSISGDTTDNGLIRLPDALKNSMPDIVVLELGANDGLRGLNLTEMKQNLSAMIDLSLAKNAEVLLVGMQLPPNYGAFYIKKFNEIYSELAREKNIRLLPFLFKGFEKDLSFFQSDKIHPNAKAQKIIVDSVWQELKPML